MGPFGKTNYRGPGGDVQVVDPADPLWTSEKLAP
jgi:hypothetical protein